MKIKMNKSINVESDLQVKLKARINSVYWYNILKDLLKENLIAEVNVNKVKIELVIEYLLKSLVPI